MDIKEVKPENFREVSVPVPMTNIQEYLTNKDLFFIVKYSECKQLRGGILLTYLSNLDLPVEILLDVDKKEKFELIKDYMNSHNMCDIQSLACLAGAVLLVHKGCGEAELSTCFHNLALTVDEMKEFIKENQETVSRWESIMDSMTIFFQLCIPGFEDAFGKYDEDFDVIDDADYVSKNFVNLLSVDYFVDLYLSKIKDSKNIKYFKHQFNDYMFKRQNLYHYAVNAKSPTLWLLMGVANGDIKYEDLEKLDDDFPDQEPIFKRPVIQEGSKGESSDG